MENLYQPVVEDKLKGLRENPMFWFLDKANLDDLQHGRKEGRFSGGSFSAETLASNPRGKLNEDSFVVLPAGEGRMLFAVLDGATSQKDISGLAPYGVSGAFYVSHLVGLGFSATSEYKRLCGEENLNARDIMVAANSWIYDKMKKVPGVDYSDTLTVPGMAAVFVLVDTNRKVVSLAQVADAGASAFLSSGETRLMTPNLNEKFDIETMEYAQKVAKQYGYSLAQLRKDTEAWAKIRAQLRESFCRKTNVKGGCGILNGMPGLVDNKLIYSDSFEISDGLSSLYLNSDGAPLPYTGKNVSMEEANRELGKAILSAPPGQLLEPGAAKLDADPNFEKIPRLKPGDDSTLIRILF